MIRTREILLSTLLLAVAVASVAAQTRPTATPTPAPVRPAATPTPTPVRPAAPQTPAADVPVPQSKIALIDTTMFADEKRGILRFIDAVKLVQAPFSGVTQELVALQNRINALIEEIRRLRLVAQVDQRTIQQKQEEGARLQQDWNTKKQRYDEDLAKRYQEVTAPLQDQIGKAMDQFARERGITMTLDLSKLLPAMLTAVPAVDVTDAFIADFNRKNPRTGTPPRP